jgi:signal transduction histidine kinase
MQMLDLNETVRGVLKTFEDEITARQIELEAEWDPDVLVTSLDPAYFSQALQNVLKNSIESMPTGGKLRVKTRRHQDLAEITISDSGKGITNADAPNLYKPFFSTKEKGMGLGLTVANRILRQHDGELTFAPGDDGGSAFALRVPLAGADDADHSGD